MFNSKGSNGSSFQRVVIPALTFGALAAALCILPACSIRTNGRDGEKNGEAKVDIKSPLGDLHVSEAPDIRDAGLTIYPGSTPAPKEGSDDNKGANVNLSLPGFSLKVVAAEFVSNDAPEKVIAYYDKELGKYGKTIQCHSAWNGSHVDSAGKDMGSKPVTCDSKESGDSTELKVGTEGNQHIVSVKPNSHGTRFALVYLRMHTGKDDTI